MHRATWRTGVGLSLTLLLWANAVANGLESVTKSEPKPAPRAVANAVGAVGAGGATGQEAAAAGAQAQGTPRFRTDQDTGPEAQSLKWFQLEEGKFPPSGSAHAISGELIRVDHLERRFHLRVDRDDSQQAGNLDLPIEGVMLPYGAVFYHGAPAALEDIPLGTHLRGQFYLKSPEEKAAALKNLHRHGRQSKEADFRRCLRLEDDFSHATRLGEVWKVDSVDFEKMKVSARLQRGGQTLGELKAFDLQRSTRVFAGSAFANRDAIQPGHEVLLNLTWATLFGPGRLLDVWLDAESREGARLRQLERHRDHIRERGLPGWISAVNDVAEEVTITFFDTFDPALFEDLKRIREEKIGWPLTREPKDPAAPKGTIAVARESMLMFDPLNDRHGGNILETLKVPVEPGCSGVAIRVQCDIMLEGFRPRRLVRFFPAAWTVKFPPLEEAFLNF